MLDDLDLNSLPDERIRTLVVRLLNIIEEVSAANQALRDENQRLRDQINRLKGEQGKPTIRPQPQSQPPAPADHSSEEERRRPVQRGKRGKRAPIIIHHDQVLAVDRALLPPDAEFKGYDEVVVQDIILRGDNWLFRKELWYSKAEGKSYRASLPAGFSGEYGPGIRALILVLHFACDTSEPKICTLLVNIGVQIAEGSISNLLIGRQDIFHDEKDAVLEAGLASSPWQHIDDTSTRVNGKNHYCQVLCNPLYTIYHTTATKSRLAVLDVLWGGRERRFRLNTEALGYLEQVAVSQVTMRRLVLAVPWEQDLCEQTLNELLTTHLANVPDQQLRWVCDALAVAAYHAQTEWPLVRLLIADDAPQWTWLSEELAGCWVHEGRHYKKLSPYLALHQEALLKFRTRFWDYYDELLTYQAAASAAERERLAAAFDSLFATETGYWALDERIAKTRARKALLLQVLEHPEIPLHNNPAELGARQRVRKRDVSFGPRTPEGARVWDTFQSLAETTRKLGVSFYAYIHDRIRGQGLIPPLADLINQRANELNLGASWAPA